MAGVMAMGLGGTAPRFNCANAWVSSSATSLPQYSAARLKVPAASEINLLLIVMKSTRDCQMIVRL